MASALDSFVSQKVRFAEEHVANKEGVRFSTKGRDWLVENLFKAADGYKLWRREDTQPCDDCGELIGSIVEYAEDNPTTGCECGGLVAKPILVTLLNLLRQDGKTFGTAGYVLATMFKQRRKSIAFLGNSEDQIERLLRENYTLPIQANPKLLKLADIKRLSISVPKRKTQVEALPASAPSVTGATRTHVVIDEARDIPAEVAWALMPAIQAMHGVECPLGHVFLNAEEAVNAPSHCTACGNRLRQWFGRLIITSSSGVRKEEGGPRDWFPELIEKLLRAPDPNVHLFQSDTPLNPQKNAEITGALQRIFGDLESMAAYVEADLSNTWQRPGEDVVTRSDIARATDKRLTNVDDACPDPVVGFLDTSISSDLTSLNLVASDTERGGDPFEHVYQARLDVWDPNDPSSCPKGVIDESEVEAHLRRILPLYPHLEVLAVDTRGMPWAQDMVRSLRKSGAPWAKKIEAWNKIGAESDVGWTALRGHIRRRPQPSIRLQDNDRQAREFRGVKLRPKTDGSPAKVVDRDRRKLHKDITEGLACCCYLAVQQRLRGARPKLSKLNKAPRTRRRTRRSKLEKEAF